MGKLKVFFTGLIAAGVVTGCGGGGNSGGFTGDNSNKSASFLGNYTIAISTPSTDAITKLTTEKGGFYSLLGGVVVTDRTANSPVEGVTVYLDAIDTIKAKGNIDSLAGTTFVDSGATLADGTATTLETAKVLRNGSYKTITGNDLILLTNKADSEDNNRSVSTAANSVSGNSITTNTAYTKTYPNATYAANTTSYVIGSSELGITLIGIDPKTGAELPGYTITDKDGIGKFHMVYPANVNTIWAGCLGAADTRFDVTSSASIYLVAHSADNKVSSVSNNYCFSAISPAVLTMFPTSASINGTVVSGSFKDKEGVGLPFATFTATGVVTKDTDASITAISATNCVTGAGGTCTSTITITGKNADDTGEIHFINASLGIDVTVNIK